VRDTEGVKDSVVARIGKAKFGADFLDAAFLGFELSDKFSFNLLPCPSDLGANGFDCASVVKECADGGSDFQTLPIAACFSRSLTTACHASPKASTNSC
jgi:hypothetical protein